MSCQEIATICCQTVCFIVLCAIFNAPSLVIGTWCYYSDFEPFGLSPSVNLMLFVGIPLSIHDVLQRYVSTTQLCWHTAVTLMLFGIEEGAMAAIFYPFATLIGQFLWHMILRGAISPDTDRNSFPHPTDQYLTAPDLVVGSCRGHGPAEESSHPTCLILITFLILAITILIPCMVGAVNWGQNLLAIGNLSCCFLIPITLAMGSDVLNNRISIGITAFFALPVFYGTVAVAATAIAYLALYSGLIIVITVVNRQYVYLL